MIIDIASIILVLILERRDSPGVRLVSLAKSLVLDLNQLFLPLEVFLLLFGDDLDVVLGTQEVPLPSGGDKALPVVVLALHLLGAGFHEDVNGDHDRLVSHEAHGEVSVASHHAMHCDVA